MRKIDLNSDVGESFGAFTMGCDRRVLESVTSANIACGYHAGDAETMKATVSMCRHLGVKVGAHPGYPDLQGFGRREMSASPEEIEAYVLYQVGALAGFAKAEGLRLSHVKAHGALYNRAAKDRGAAEAYVRAVKSFDPSLIIVGLAGSVVMDVARNMGMMAASEAFADRAYNPDGSLVPRSVSGSVIHDRGQVVERAVRMATEGVVLGVDSKAINLEITTICLHGDTEGAAILSREIREAIAARGVNISPMEEILRGERDAGL